MKRRNFITTMAAGSGGLISATVMGNPFEANGIKESQIETHESSKRFSADLVIAGGGLGGCAAAFAALRNNLSVIMTEETDWIGGQVSQQGVPPDEHQWIETHGAPALYRTFRKNIRDYYRRNYPLTAHASENEFLNPGNGSVSRICHEPRVAVQVLNEMFAPYVSARKLVILKGHKVVKAEVNYNKVKSLISLKLKEGKTYSLEGRYFIDATELGDMLPLTGTAYRTGSESREETGEWHASSESRPDNNQAFTMCFAMDYLKGEDWTIPKPTDYDFWNQYQPDLTPSWAGKLLELNYSDPKTLQPKNLGFHPEGEKTGNSLNLWLYRRLLDPGNFKEGFYKGGASIVNWPQNDYMLGNIVDVSENELKNQVDQAKQLSLSMLYWLQTEAPRPDGGRGWPGLRLRNDMMGTSDGLAMYPYVREARRIKALFTILEEHVGAEQRANVSGLQGAELKSAHFHDSVGIGYYHIDLHPSSGGDNYIDFGSLPFQIPLGALIPEKMENLLPANKNIGTTHITNGCYRLHPVEWSIGEAVGMLVPFVLEQGMTPRQVREDKEKLADFQSFIQSQGIETAWPDKV
ncbi:MAG: FAD-dependent oxidoreductase [Cyclobacteriaceae bacterium]